MNRSEPRPHGQYDWRVLADMHRPANPEVIAAEIRRLRLTGLMPRDIANALRVDIVVVVTALGPMEGHP